MKQIIEKSLKNSYTYEAFKALISNLLAEGKSTGPTQSKDLTNYSLLNERRMKRLDKTTTITKDLVAIIKEINQPQTWLVLTEGWCGDAAQNIPIINKIVAISNCIDFKLVLRDENEGLMNLFLTNSGKAIPKLIALDKENNVLYTWGPRPSEATKMVENYKANQGILDANFKKDLQVWYNKNKGKNIEDDFMKLIKYSQSKAV